MQAVYCDSRKTFSAGFIVFRSCFDSLTTQGNGSAINAVFYNSQSCRIKECSFTCCSSTDTGGAVYIKATAESTINISYISITTCLASNFGLAFALDLSQDSACNISCIGATKQSTTVEGNDHGGTFYVTNARMHVRDYNVSKSYLADWIHGVAFMITNLKAGDFGRALCVDTENRCYSIEINTGANDATNEAISINRFLIINNILLAHPAYATAGAVVAYTAATLQFGIFRGNSKDITDYTITSRLGVEDCVFDTDFVLQYITRWERNKHNTITLFYPQNSCLSTRMIILGQISALKQTGLPLVWLILK